MRRKSMLGIASILILYSLITMAAVSVQFGNLVLMAAGIFLTVDAFCYPNYTKKGKRIVNGILILSLTAALILTGIMLMAAHGCTAQQGSNRTVIVLGAKVNGDQPSLMLSRRLSAGLEYAMNNPDSMIIVTGGQGENESMAESTVMKQWLIRHGISSDRILEEDQACNTGENLSYSEKIMTEHSLNREVVIATDSFHQLRARILAEQAGLEKIETVNADTPLLFRPMYFVREWFGLVKAVIFKK